MIDLDIECMQAFPIQHDPVSQSKLLLPSLVSNPDRIVAQLKGESLLHGGWLLESLFSTCCLQFSNGETPLAASEAGEDFTEAGNRPPIFRYRCVLQQWQRPSAPISDIEKISTMSRRHETKECPKSKYYIFIIHKNL